VNTPVFGAFYRLAEVEIGTDVYSRRNILAIFSTGRIGSPLFNTEKCRGTESLANSSAWGTRMNVVQR
jgi:hypothetical protein